MGWFGKSKGKHIQKIVEEVSTRLDVMDEKMDKLHIMDRKLDLILKDTAQENDCTLDKD